jgi:capsular exopolysaccharide synthesis family protein
MRRAGTTEELGPIAGTEPEKIAAWLRQNRPGSGRQETDVAVFVQILQRNWRIILVCTATVFLVVASATLLMKPIYEPEARLEIDPPGNEQFALDLPHIAANDTEYLQTQVQNLQSEELAVAVIRELQLAPDSLPRPPQDDNGSSSAPDMSELTPGENATLREFKQRLKVQHDPGSRLIGVAFAAHDPLQAARITNTLASLYQERMSKARTDAVEQSVEWLSGQLEDIHKRMQDSNSALADFESKNGVADVGEGKSTFGELLAELNKQQTQTAADRIQLQALLSEQDDENPDSLPQVHQSLLIQQLTQKLAEVRAELAQARAIYGPNHPNVKRLENQGNELEAQLKQQKQSILDELKKEYAAAQARERLMSREVKETTRQLTLMAQYNGLKREAQANATLYNTLYSKIKDAEISAASKSSNIRVVDRARVLDRPTRPRRRLNAGLGLAGGLVLGVLIAFVREGLQSRLRTPEDVQQWCSTVPVSILPIIGADGTNGNGGARRLLQMMNTPKAITGYEALLLSRPESAEAEAVRGLHAALTLSGSNHQPPQALLIASSLPGEGKTTVAMNLAVAFSQQERTCVVDCDLRNSAMSSIFKRVSDRGLTDVLTAKTALAQAVFDTHIPNLFVMPSGRSRGGARDLVTPRAMKETLEALRQRFAFIVLDSPPILPCVDGRVLSTIVDGVILVGRSRVTTRVAMLRSLELLAEVRSAPILEVVLNAAESDSPDYRYYRYGYK